jgi:hypothetical protein
MESILWSYERGAGARSLTGAEAAKDPLPILSVRPHLERFLSSARALDLLRPVRDSIRRGTGSCWGDGALPQWGTGLPGEVRVWQGNTDGDVDVARMAEEDRGCGAGGGQHEDRASRWGY